jgi:hypothetical protein
MTQQKGRYMQRNNNLHKIKTNIDTAFLFCFTIKLLCRLTCENIAFLRSCQLCSHSKTSQHFKEPEGPYPEPVRSSPYHPILSVLRSILILSTKLHLGFPSGLFLSGFPTNIPHRFCFSPHSCYMPCPSHPP